MEDLKSQLIAQGCKYKILIGGFAGYTLDGELVARRCRKCKELLRTESFLKDRGKVEANCITCSREITRKSYKKNHLKRKAKKSRVSLRANKEFAEKLLREGCTYRKLYKGLASYSKDGELVARECSKCLALLHVASYSVSSKASRTVGGLHPWCKDCCKVYKLENPVDIEKKRLYKDNWLAANPNYTTDYARANPHIFVAAMARRRAVGKLLPSVWGEEDFQVLDNYFGEGMCALTGEVEGTHLEHAVPISIGQGGTNRGNCYRLVGNLNQSKRDNHLFEWFEDNRDRFELEQSRFDRLIEYLAQQNDMTPAEYRKYVDWCHDNPREVVDGELVFIKDLRGEDVAL